jgi:hypothetical protein
MECPMPDLLWQLKDVSSFTISMSLVFAGVVFWFIREIVGAPMLAMLSVPLLLAGGVLMPIVFQSQMIALSYDPDTNVAAATAVGVLAALVVLVIGKWLWMVVRERQVRQIKLTAVAPKPRVFR